MTTKDKRAVANDLQQAALRAAQALRDGHAAAIGAVAGTHTGSETCAQTIARVAGLNK
jgi:hypothetical protein